MANLIFLVQEAVEFFFNLNFYQNPDSPNFPEKSEDSNETSYSNSISYVTTGVIFWIELPFDVFTLVEVKI